MNTTTTSSSVIKTTVEEIKENVIENYIDILQDHDLRDSEQREFHQQDCNSLYGYLDQLDEFSIPGVTQLFRDGMTPLMLSAKDFHDIEAWFRENDYNNNVLEIHITNKAGSMMIINHEDISY